MSSDVKAINLDNDTKRPKQKVILFDQFKNSKGARFTYRLKNLYWDFYYAKERLLYGYEPPEVFDLGDSFVRKYSEILKQFKNGHGHPCGLEYEEWQNIIQKMIDLLSILSEDKFDYAVEKENGKYDWEPMIKFSQDQERACKEFFELFSLYFFDLWD